MLTWQANFQIPNSGVQAAMVYAFVEEENIVRYYADQLKTTLLFEKQFTIPANSDPYAYLLTLEEFKLYKQET